MLETQQFYDDLASYYHLIFEDWDASMARQGDTIAQLIKAELGHVHTTEVQILDAACGIGTQTLPLAARGFQLTARDISPGAVTRLKQEAETRHVIVDAAVADMRQVASSVSGSFDMVLAFDNSLAHLLNDTDLRSAFHSFMDVLRPGGAFLSSVRDYDKVQRGVAATHDYGPREYRGNIFRLKQEWSWDDPMHYKSTFTIHRQTPEGVRKELCTVSPFYAVSTDHLLTLMRESGFQDCRRVDDAIYQPILIGRKTA